MPRTFLVGQAFYARINFRDMEAPAYDRPYLVVGVDDGYIEILNVSSVVGKEWKLAMPTNLEIINYDPPFPKRTFVKLDSLQRVPISSLGNVSFFRKGAKLDANELAKIMKSIIR